MEASVAPIIPGARCGGREALRPGGAVRVRACPPDEHGPPDTLACAIDLRARRAARPARTLRVDVSGHPGTQVRVEVHHPDAPTVALFEAGLGLPMDVWHPVIEHLPEVCCILADRPGLGGSTPWEHPPGLADHVALIADVLAACSVDPAQPVALVGHSYAGILVKAFARMHPERVAALVLVDPSLASQEASTTTLVEQIPRHRPGPGQPPERDRAVAGLGVRRRRHGGPGRGQTRGQVDCRRVRGSRASAGLDR